MYCRVCGAQVNENAEICTKCGCRPLTGNEYCQECGEKTNEKQEICLKCGCLLRTANSTATASRAAAVSGGVLDSISDSLNGPKEANGEMNLNFSALPAYYQEEFQKIYESNESYKGKFNLFAFLFGALWALSKRCWLAALVAIAVGLVSAGIGLVAFWIVFGVRGTYIYYRAYVKHQQSVI